MKTRVLLCTALLALASCDQGTTSFASLEPFKGEHLIEFDGSREDQQKYRVSHGYSNRGMFASYWDYSQVRYEDGVARLALQDKDDGKNYGAEIRTHKGYLYGYFGGRIKTFKHSGTVQSLFTYNGGQYAWDEIDIEFLGKDTTKVQFNYFHNGQGGHEHMHNLGFDSSEAFHEYGFKWEPDTITWFVDGIPVYQVKASLPQWGNFFINVWAGNMDQGTTKRWLGNYDKTTEPLEACYDYLTYAPLEEN